MTWLTSREAIERIIGAWISFDRPTPGGSPVRTSPSTWPKRLARRATNAGAGSTSDCGHVGCCESQAGDARRHAIALGHPVILSLATGEGFTWCYEEGVYVG